MTAPTKVETTSASPLASTGIEGLDDVLQGGLAPNRLYLIEGVPGSGKTTLALQYLLEGVRHGEKVLYVTLSETEEELRSVAASHGWSLDGITIHEVASMEGTAFDGDEDYTVSSIGGRAQSNNSGHPLGSRADPALAGGLRLAVGNPFVGWLCPALSPADPGNVISRADVALFSS